MVLMNTVQVPVTSPITFPGLNLTINWNANVFPGTSIGILSNIRWYGVLIAFGFLLAVIYCNRRCAQFGVTQDQILDMLICAVPASIVCARAYYCLFYWELFADDPISCLYIWNGGIAIYGAVIGAAAAAVLYCRIKKVPLGAMLDVGALGLLIGQCIGRWGNFMNREAFGGETASALRMGLIDINGKLAYYHPTFLYESVWNLLGFVLLHFYSKKRKFDGELFWLYVAWYGFGRGWIEGLRTDSLMLFATGIRVSQLLGFVSCAAALGIWLFIRIRKKPEAEGLYVRRSKAQQEEKIG